MEFFIGGILGALWLGILTSISPCPLATNIAAISFIGKKFTSMRLVFLSGLLYTLGRMFAYFAIAVVLVATALSVPEIARFLQQYINIILGPLLILTGLLLLNVFSFNLGTAGFIQKLQGKAENKGLFGSFMLGIIFALAFCPLSAALFFGSLIPLAMSYNSDILLPLLYGLGTALPVIVFSFVIAFSASKVGEMFNKLQKVEWWAQRITGVLFILIGIYFVYLYIFA